MPQAVNKRVNIATIGTCFIVGLGIYVLVMIAAYFTQASIIFSTGGLTARPPGVFPIAQVTFTTADGLPLNGWWLNTAAAQCTVIYFQGNRRSPSEYRRRLRTLSQLDANALIFDYRGYGQSPGHIQEEEDIYRDGLAAWEYLCRERAIAPEDIILWGRSLGGAVAVEVARRRPIGGIVLESTFNSLGDMAAYQYGWLPARRLLRFQFDSGAKVAQIRAPLIVIHSPEDRYIPIAQAQDLFRQASPPKYFLETSGSHLDLFEEREEHQRAFRRQWQRLISRCEDYPHAN